MSKHAVIGALTVVFLGILASDVYACRCRQWGGNESHSVWIKREAQQSEFVFAGKVLAMRKGTEMRAMGHVITMRVTRSWKGPGQRSVTMQTGGTSCDYKFERGKEYLIFTSPAPPKYIRRSRPLVLTTDLCTPTSPLKDAGETAAILNEIYARKK